MTSNLRFRRTPGRSAGDEELLGTLFLTFRQPRRFGPPDLRTARGLAALATTAVANARLHQQALAALVGAEERARSSVRLLARVVDAKDPSTREHSERVAELSKRLAEALGWPPHAVRRLGGAALVHDVGKIGVPDGILFRRGPLSKEEYAKVKEHAELGAELIGEVLNPEQVMWVRHHHERWDGGGYPEGLQGDAIPEGACVLAIADAWDVMTNARGYSPMVSEAEALEECRAGSGTQFSPRVIGALERVKSSSGRHGGPPSSKGHAAEKRSGPAQNSVW